MHLETDQSLAEKLSVSDRKTRASDGLLRLIIGCIPSDAPARQRRVATQGNSFQSYFQSYIEAHMRLTKWSDIKKTFSPERQARIAAEVAKMNAEIAANKEPEGAPASAPADSDPR
jgi:hypothetical protein